MLSNWCPRSENIIEPISLNVIQDICNEYATLRKRLCSLQPRRKRIYYLALPKHRTPKYRSRLICQRLRKSQIYRDPPVRTRTDQLALPQARKLLEMQKEFSHLFPPERMTALNRTLRTTMLSAFGALSNVKPPSIRPCYCQWSQKDWRQHAKAFGRLAEPKKKIVQPIPARVWKDINLMDRYKALCKPKKKEQPEKIEWVLSDAAKKYIASDRVLELCKPKQRNELLHFQPLPIKVSPEALSYHATKRIIALAIPLEKRLADNDVKDNPFGVDPNALRAKASARIKDLAEPKEYVDKHTRANPNAISPAALKAKASPRTIELAQPKKRG